MKFYNDFIGHDQSNKVLKFSGGDEENTFLENLKKMPEDWYYRNKIITYTYNDHGHRCKNINEIDFDNYILFVGCSHTEGVGVELENTYCNVVAKHLNLDYYNIALGASGLDVLEHNVSLWFRRFHKKPRYLIIQWPDHSRFCITDYNVEHISPKGSWNLGEYEKKFVAGSEILGFNSARKLLCRKLISSCLQQDIKLITISFSALSQYGYDDLIWRCVDYARDLSHSGIKSHLEIANKVIEETEKL
jgi:hypothetical protein